MYSKVWYIYKIYAFIICVIYMTSLYYIYTSCIHPNVQQNTECTSIAEELISQKLRIVFLYRIIGQHKFKIYLTWKLFPQYHEIKSIKVLTVLWWLILASVLGVLVNVIFRLYFEWSSNVNCCKQKTVWTNTFLMYWEVEKCLYCLYRGPLILIH